MRFTARRKLNPLLSDLSGSLEEDEGCTQVSDSELLPGEIQKKKGFVLYPLPSSLSTSTKQQLTWSAATILQSCEEIFH